MDEEQINRIIKSCNFKYKQQESNMKNKLKKKNYLSILQKALDIEIEYLNNQIKSKNNLLDIIENKYRNK